MRLFWGCVVLVSELVLGATGWAQEPAREAPGAPQEERTQPKKQEEKEVLITAPSPLREEALFDAPYSAEVLNSGDLQGRKQSRSTPEALKEVPGVHVQRTGPAQAAPVIRGMTGYHTLLLIDGIRLNNSAFRSGPNQYWATVDPFLVGRLEIIRGPASVLYGSDALGGTAYAHTIEPEFEGPGVHFHERTYGRFASADKSYTARLEVSGNLDDLGWVFGGTYRDFNDVNGGRHYGLMKGTGFDEYDADGKFIVRLSEASKLILAAQHHRTDDAARWHSTNLSKSFHGTTTGSDRQRDFDQERNLYYVQYHWTDEKAALLNAFKASVSWHRQGESETRVLASGNREFREFVVNTPGAWVQAGAHTGIGFVTVGAEFYRDLVRSRGHNWTGGTLVAFERGSIADDSTYELFGVYVQDEFTLGPLDVTPGVRFSRAKVDAEEVDPDPSDTVVFDPLEDTYQGVTGSLRLVYHIDERWNLIAGWGMGFRAPTLDDSTAIKLVMSGALDIPAEDLDPERTHTFDVGFRARYPIWEVAAFAFYTRLQDFIIRVPAGDYNGDSVNDFTKDNVSDGWIYGFEVSALYRLTEEFSLFGSWGYAKGRSDQILTGGIEVERPLSKMNPWTMLLGGRYEPQGLRVWVEALATIVDRQSHLSAAEDGSAGTPDAQRIPQKHGTPGYTVYTVRGGYTVTENLKTVVAVENVTDKDYRHHGSGVNEPGTNFIVSAEVRF